MSQYPYPTQYFTTQAGIQIAFIDVGQTQNETLVWVHGITSNLLVWEKNIDVLQKYYRCIALDWAGHGLSDKGDYSYSLEFYGQILLELLQHLQIKTSINLIAHSMGGQIAIKFSLKQPEWINKLVLVAPAGFENFTSNEKMILGQITTTGIISHAQYYKFILNLKDYFYDLNEKEYQKLAEFNRDFYDVLQNPMLSLILERSVKAMLYEPVLQDLPKIKIPTLIFFGKNDKLIPNRLLHQTLTTEYVAQSASKRIKGSKLIFYEKSGHFLQYEQPSKFNIDLHKFIVNLGA